MASNSAARPENWLASLPAQRVLVTDALDLSRLDPASVSLGAIGFGGTWLLPPPGLTSFYARVSRSPTLAVSVNGRQVGCPLPGTVSLPP